MENIHNLTIPLPIRKQTNSKVNKQLKNQVYTFKYLINVVVYQLQCQVHIGFCSQFPGATLMALQTGEIENLLHVLSVYKINGRCPLSVLG